MEYQQLKTKQQKILFKIDLVIGILSLAILVTSIFHIFTNTINVGYFSGVEHNWDGFVITDFNKDCPEGEGYTGFIYFYIGEFTNGCGCPNNLNNTEEKDEEKNNADYTIYKGECNPSQISNNCVNIGSISKNVISKYKGTEFCYKGILSYLKLLARIENGKCKEGYKKCGILDSLGQPFCRREIEDCSHTYLIDLNYTESENSIKLGNQFWNYEKTSDPETEIISEIIVADNKPCIDSTDLSLSFLYNVLYEHYKKDGENCTYKINYKNKDIKENPFYHTFGNITPVKDLLEENNAVFFKDLHYDNNTMNKLNEAIKFNYRSYIGFKEECYKDKGKYNNTFIREGIEADYNKSFYSFKICVIMLGLDLFSMLIVIWISFSPKCLFLIRLIKQVAYLFDILLAINVFSILKFESIYNECGDELTNVLILTAHKSLRNHEILTCVYLIFSITVFGINIVECHLQRKDINEKKTNDEIKLELYS